MKRFCGNGDATVTDTPTRLMWQQEDDGQERSYDEAQSYCGSLMLAGHSDWRLPSLQELSSIVVEGSTNNIDDIFTSAKRDKIQVESMEQQSLSARHISCYCGSVDRQSHQKIICSSIQYFDAGQHTISSHAKYLCPCVERASFSLR